MRFRFSELFTNYRIGEIKLKSGFAEISFSPSDGDQDAAWEMYVELITRVITQPLNVLDGDEAAALDSVYSLFPTTRSILKTKGRHAENFSKIAVIVLNQVIRPFTAKWHKKKIEGAFSNPDDCAQFRTELCNLQSKMKGYSKLLADMAMVEDITDIVE